MNTTSSLSRQIISVFLALTLTGFVYNNSIYAADVAKERIPIEVALSRLQLSKADDLISKLSDRGYEKFYACNLLMYQFFSTQDAAYLQDIRAGWKTTLSTIETLPEADPLKYVLLAELYCKRSALEFMDQNYLTSVRLARTGRSIIRRNQNKHPENIEQLKLIGIMNALLGSIPNKYQWITNSLGFRGNLSEGIKQLELASSRSTLMRQEAQLLLSFVEKNILDQPDRSMARLSAMHTETEANMVIDFFWATALLRMKRNEEALSILNNRDLYATQEVFTFPFWDYQLGKAYYFKNDHRNAQRYLARFIKQYKGKLGRVDANFRLGMALTLNRSYTLGKQFFMAVADEKELDLDEDEYARHQAQSFQAQEPNKHLQSLFRARNYFDGGYYEKAMDELIALQSVYPQLSTEEKTELHYRYGRILHAQGDVTQAGEQYQQCINQSPLEDLKWLQAYSWFYQATIAREQGNVDLAKERYQKALSFDKHFYQTGLKNRCKAALSDLKQTG